MGGLLVLFLAVAYLSIVISVTLKVRTWQRKLVSVLVFVLIPTADAVYGRIRLKQMCETEGGLKIFRAIDGVQGFYDSSTRPLEEWIKTYGYKFIEGNEPGGTPARMSLADNGKIVLERNVTLISKYVYEYSVSDRNGTYVRIEKWIRVRDTGEILGRTVNISYMGGWVEQILGAISDSGGTAAGTCGPDVSIIDLVTKTLRPLK
jgi:hypothetical protein